MGFFSKFILFGLNFIVFVVGACVIALASIILVHGQEFQQLVGKGTFTLPTILLIIGISVTLLGFFGCFGALRESRCLLYTYATIVLALLLAQVAVVIYGAVQKEELKKFVSDSMTSVLEKFGGSDDELTKSLDQAQHTLECCGTKSYKDWFNGDLSDAKIPDGGDVPLGCCRNKDNASCNQNIKGGSEEDIESRIYTNGCFTKFKDVFETQSLWMIVGAAVLALVQMICIVVACGIGRHAPDHNSHVY